MLIQYRIKFTDDGVIIGQCVDLDGCDSNGSSPPQPGTVVAKKLGSSFQEPGGGMNPNTGPGGAASASGPIKAIILGPLIIMASNAAVPGSGGGMNPNTGPGGGMNQNTGPGGAGNASGPASANPPADTSVKPPADTSANPPDGK